MMLTQFISLWTRSTLRISILLCLLTTSQAVTAQSIRHDLDVSLTPSTGSLAATDHIALPSPHRALDFRLNAGLKITSSNGTLTPTGSSDNGLVRQYQVRFSSPAQTLELSYQGKPRFPDGSGMGGMPQGALDPDGVYLDSASAWHPLMDAQIDAPIKGIQLRVTLPPGWQSLSTGRRSSNTSSPNTQIWTTEQPLQSLYLLAGQYTRHLKRHGDIDLSVYLLKDDADLANQYLSVMSGYIDHYSDLIGPYPYAQFAVVENRWQTGYGMPSFTLLGSRVIRLPFIPYTSLPHEILHNWWGNGVWVDYSKGNWSEGLTAYLADHWMQERRGKGAAYRLKALQRYSNFAASGEDRPLLAFTSRHNDASQSIGYSKSLMLFHMLRQQLGEEHFRAGLRRLWHQGQYRRLGFQEVIDLLTQDRPELSAQAQFWLQRTGAASLSLRNVTVTPVEQGYQLRFSIQQTEPAFPLSVPVAVTLEGETEARLSTVPLSGLETDITLRFKTRPTRLDIDPAFDVLRLLSASEQPPALNRLFGGNTVAVIPSQASATEQAAWMDMIRTWKQERYPQLRSVTDQHLSELSTKDDLLVLGWENRLLKEVVSDLRRPEQTLTSSTAQLGDRVFDAGSSSVILLNTDTRGRTVGFIGSPNAKAIQTLTRKLPHYGSYGQLAFEGSTGRNILKHALTSRHSRLSIQLGKSPASLRLPSRP